ncbi:MAG TPA: ABC transporter ATP-binding protein [Candidatus Limnocylindria bacterium]|nr:ABC transporter ATP-binding protein [Candidatus Limnocylindria bacterium]
MTERAPALEMRGITKRFPGTVANDGIDLGVHPGEIRALLGENGAGKTTLVNILYGLVTPDSGEILIDGSAVRIADPADAIARGIGMVHQHFMLVPVLSVVENVILGDEVTRGPFLDLAAAGGRVRALARQLGFEIDPEARVESLSVGQQQRIEILKAIYREARILVLDEPTAVLTPQEALEIFEVLRRLRSEGRSVIFISHKLDEALAIADRITVIRRGKVVGTRLPNETSEAELAELMVGREVSLRVDRGTSRPGDVVLVVEGLHAKNDRGHETLRGVDLDVRAGEIHGIAGVAGNGQDELVGAIVGLRKASAGRITFSGRDVTGASPRELQHAGQAHVPGDRHRFGLVLTFSVADNLVLTNYHDPPFAYGPFELLRGDAAVGRRATALVEEFDVRTPSTDVAVSSLSGGNQQKLVVAREFRPDVKLLVLDQPTRGLDVGSVEFIHRRVVAARDAGMAVLLVSAELDEVLDLSDRVSVMYRGRLVATVPAEEAKRERIGLLMAKGAA